eukprot:s5487_g3.t1
MERELMEWAEFLHLSMGVTLEMPPPLNVTRLRFFSLPTNQLLASFEVQLPWTFDVEWKRERAGGCLARLAGLTVAGISSSTVSEKCMIPLASLALNVSHGHCDRDAIDIFVPGMAFGAALPVAMPAGSSFFHVIVVVSWQVFFGVSSGVSRDSVTGDFVAQPGKIRHKGGDQYIFDHTDDLCIKGALPLVTATVNALCILSGLLLYRGRQLADRSGDLVTLYPPDYASFRFAVESRGSLDAKERGLCLHIMHGDNTADSMLHREVHEIAKLHVCELNLPFLNAKNAKMEGETTKLTEPGKDSSDQCSTW